MYNPRIRYVIVLVVVVMLLLSFEAVARQWGYTILQRFPPQPPQTPQWAHALPGWEDIAIAQRDLEQRIALQRQLGALGIEFEQWRLDHDLNRLKEMTRKLDFRGRQAIWEQSMAKKYGEGWRDSRNLP